MNGPRQELISERLALGLLALVPLVLFWPSLFAGKMLWGADIQTLELVFKTAARRAADRGEWPLWMPEILGGMPGIAASNLVFLHPLELLLFAVGVEPWMAFGLESAAEVGLAGLGFWLLLRRLGLSRGASLLGSLAWVLSGTQVSLLFAGHINNSKALAAIPYVFWGALKGWQEGKLLGWALAGAAMAWQILGLGLQVFAYTLIAFAAFAAWLPFSALSTQHSAPRRHALLGFAVTGLAAFCLAAPQLLPSLSYKAHSWREGFSYEQFTSWSFHPKESLGWIVPGFYGWREPGYRGDWAFCLTTEYFGLLPWMLAAAALGAVCHSEPWRERLRRPEAFFALLAAFAFLAGIGKHFPLHHLFYRLPVYSGFRTWTRFLCFLTFGVSVLAAFGWDALLRDGAERARRWALYFAGFALLVALGALGTAQGSVLTQSGMLTQKLGQGGVAQALQAAQASAYKAGVLALLLLAALAAWGRLRKFGAGFLALAVLFHVADASEVPKRFLDFRAPAELVAKPAWLGQLPDGQGPEPFRVLDLPGLWMQNGAALHGYETVQGYHGVQMAAPMKLIQALNARQLEWASVMNTRYILSPEPLSLPPGYTQVLQGPPYAYRNPHDLGRAYFVNQADTVPSDEEAFKVLGAPGYNVLNRVTVDQPVTLDPGPAKAGLRWIQPRGNRVAMEAEVDRRSLLVLSQTWYPSWAATVDGQPTPIVKADGGALTAIVLPAGRHQVEFRFSPRLYQLSGLLAALGLLALFMIWKREAKGGTA